MHKQRYCIAMTQSCSRVGWTRGSGRVRSGRVGSGRVGSGSGLGHDFAGFWRVGSALRIFWFVTDYFLVTESI